MADVFLYLTTIGRSSGAERQIEIWFVEHGGRHYVVAELREQAGWVKNLTKQPRVSFSVGTRSDRVRELPATPALARALEEGDELTAAVKAKMEAKYGWSDGLVVELDRTVEP